MEEQQKCAYCGANVDPGYCWVGPTTGNLYCPDAMIRECLKTLGSRVEMIDCTYYPPPIPRPAGAAA